MFSFFLPAFSVYEASRKHLIRRQVELFTSEGVSSTNDLAKEEAFSLSTPVKFYLTDRQTSGRGRGKNTWSNVEPGKALLMSASFEIPQAAQPVCTPLVGLAVYRTLKNHFQAQFSLKAPNDILLKGKKMGGILVEAAQMGNQHRLIVGLGLNVFNHPDDLENLTHLSQQVKVRKNSWLDFIDELSQSLKKAAQDSMGTHLSDSQRAEILIALNQNPNLESPFESVSPFGDLHSRGKSLSWREL